MVGSSCREPPQSPQRLTQPKNSPGTRSKRQLMPTNTCSCHCRGKRGDFSFATEFEESVLGSGLQHKVKLMNIVRTNNTDSRTNTAGCTEFTRSVVLINGPNHPWETPENIFSSTIYRCPSSLGHRLHNSLHPNQVHQILIRAKNGTADDAV